MPNKKNKFGGNNWGKVIGLTGGMGTGKTTGLSEFKKLGALTVNSDGLVQSLLKNKKIQKRITREILRPQETFSKGKLAQVVFSDSNKRIKLEKIIHPLVAREINKILKKRKGEVAVVEVPLLFEAGWEKYFDATLLIQSNKRRKSGRFSPEEINRRTKAQWPFERKKKKADFVVFNNGSKDKLKNNLMKFWSRLVITGPC